MMMVGETTLSEYLHRLVVVTSEQELENLLLLLWQTRKTGLSASQKSSLQTLLHLPSAGDLGPVLASLRSLIRNCVHKNLEGDDILKLLPPDLPLQLQSMLLVSLQRYLSQWKGQLSQEQNVLGCIGFSHQVNVAQLAPFSSFTPSEVSVPLSLQLDPVPQLHGHNLGGQRPITDERNLGCFPQLALQNDIIPPEFLEVLPQMKFMTWTVENKSATPANRVAIIALKLQDCTKSPSNEMEVKFQLTKDTLDAVLRSMTYINEQLSQKVGSSLESLQKKQRH